MILTTIRSKQETLRNVTPNFNLTYIRTGPRGSLPFVVLPGGPGLASILPYRGFRSLAAKGKLDVIMIEHRGVGFSRKDVAGKPLPHSAMFINHILDDIVAVLQQEKVSKAFIVGASYGSYLAMSFGVKYPQYVAGMILDSTFQSITDIECERQLLRAIFLGTKPASLEVQNQVPDGLDYLQSLIKKVIPQIPSEKNLLDVVRAAYELNGMRLLIPLLELRLKYSKFLTWTALENYAYRTESITRIRGHFEFDIAGAIAFRELNYGALPDGAEFDPALTYAPLVKNFPSFAGEPFELVSQIASFDWSVVLLSGYRDLRTPTAIAKRVHNTVRNGLYIEIDNGHSALESHPLALLNVMRMLQNGTSAKLPAMVKKLNALPRIGVAAKLPSYLMKLLKAEEFLLNK